MARSRGLAGLVVTAAALAYGTAAWLVRPDLGFWSPDSSIRYVQLGSLVRHEFKKVDAFYPGAGLDPEARFFPISSGFAVVRDGKVYLAYSPYFPALAAPVYRLLGPFGLVVLPLASGLLVVWLSCRWFGRFVPDVGAVGGLAVGLGTPLAVYSVVFWDHAPVAALTAGSLVLLTADFEARRSVAFLAGALTGIAMWFRNEAYIFAVALATSWAVVGGWRRLPPLVAGMLCAAAPVWLLNWHLYGHPLGLKGLTGTQAVAARLGGAQGWLWGRLLAAYDLLISIENFQNASSPKKLSESVGVVGVLAGSGLLLRLGAANCAPTSVYTAGLAVGAVAAWLVTNGSEVMGLLPAVPVLVMLGLSRPKDGVERLVGLATALYVLGVLATGSEGGLQWGPRYLLPAVPGLVWLAFSGLARVYEECNGEMRRAVAVCALLSVAASFALQAAGIWRVRSQVLAGARVEAILRSVDSPILVTGMEPLFRFLGYLYFDRVLMSVEGPDELQDLVVALARQRVPRWTYIPFSGRAFDARSIERWTLPESWRFRVVEDWTPLAWVVESGRPISLRLITYRGDP